MSEYEKYYILISNYFFRYWNINYIIKKVEILKNDWIKLWVNYFSIMQPDILYVDIHPHVEVIEFHL